MTTSTGDYRLEFAGISDTGSRRTRNEDWWHCGFLWDDRCVLAVVADGVGGYAGGEVAARMATEEIVSYLRHNRDGERSWLLKQALIHANNAVFGRRQREDRLHRMCCVLTAALFDPDRDCIYMAHVGDTRLYAFSDGRIIKLSHDQSPVGRDEDTGIISETEAMQNPYRNIIDRAVGQQILVSGDDFIETNVFPMGKGITWLLCSDGLSDMITSARMSSILGTDNILADKVRLLTEAANDAGGNDNITVVLVAAGGEPDTHTSGIMDAYASNVIIPAAADDTDYGDCTVQDGTPGSGVELPDNTGIDDGAGVKRASVRTVTGKPSRTFLWLPLLMSLLAGLTVVLLTFLSAPGGGHLRQREHERADSIAERQRYERLYYNINNLPLQHNTRE